MSGFLFQRALLRYIHETVQPPRLTRCSLHPPKKRVSALQHCFTIFKQSSTEARVFFPQRNWKSIHKFCEEKAASSGIQDRFPRFGIHQDVEIFYSFAQTKEVEVEFADGSVFHLSAEFLRIYSPAADSKIRSVGGEKVVFGRRHVGIMSAEPIGNYGIRIVFDDLHKTGIYTWDYFYHLGSNKFSLMRNYIKTLKKHGLSRDPQRRK